MAAAAGLVRSHAAEDPSRLEFRKITDAGLEKTGVPIPRDAIRVFLYLGQPKGIHVDERHIAVDYGRLAGVLFDRASGKPVRRYTVADGWPEARPEPFPPLKKPGERVRVCGPGIVQVWRPYRPGEKEVEMVSAASAIFGGRQWRALQPAGFLTWVSREGYKGPPADRRTGPLTSWTGILRRLNEQCYLEADGKRYTMTDGLPSNIVTHLAVSQGSLWAACVDIYDSKKETWGPGGLARFDPAKDRWEQVEKIDGRPVRWVTMLQTVGDELWVGFREGVGVEGDRVYYGMGISAGIYRPKTTAVVLARGSSGKWTTFARPPLPDVPKPLRRPGSKEGPPTEMPLKLARTDDHVMLYSGVGRSSNFNFHYTLNGRISLLDLPTGKWRIYDVHEDFGAGALREMTGEGGEILVTGNRGAHRWDAEGQTWQFLDPNGELKNPALGAVAPRDNELWVGYTTESFGVIGRHSIGVLDEKTLTWSYHSPEKIGTACPVERIFAVPSGEVWVLFGRREYFARLALVASARPAPFTEAKPQTPRLPGLGRFADGKWVFPVNIPVARVPKTEPPRPGAMRREDVADLAAIRDRLFVAMDDGVYMGPGKWQRIVEGRVLVIEPSEDGKALLVYPEPPARRPAGSKIKRSRYDPATGKVALEEVELEEGYRQWLYRRYSFLLAGRDRRWRQNWVRVPTAKAGDWTVGPLEAESHRVIETPYGVWIASRGQLIRLDRKRLAEWLEK